MRTFKIGSVAVLPQKERKRGKKKGELP